MYFIPVKSDQLYTWSDENQETDDCRVAKTPQRSPTPVAAASRYPARFSHRALQTMRQAGLQMLRRPRPWPQILSVGQLSGLAAANGLRAAGILRPNGRISCQLPPGPRNLRGDLRDQPRTASPSRGALKGRHERSAFCPPSTDGCKVGGRASRQYARSLARRQPRGFVHYGDSR
jgi:hypothetical protein